MNLSKIFINLSNLSIRKIFIFFFSVSLVLWGTSWKIPIFNLPVSYFWLFCVVSSLFFFNKSSLKKQEIAVLAFLGLFISFYFVLGISDSISSDNPNADLSYLFIYFIKFIFGFLLVFSLVNIIEDLDDVRTFFNICSVIILITVAYLAWKYLVVYELDYIGVIVDDSIGGAKTFKNSLATSLALITPFILVGIFQKGPSKYLSYLGLFAILFFLFWVNSRSSIIILGIEFLVFMFLSKSKKIKKVMRYSSVAFVAVLLVSGISFNDWIKKSGEFSDSGYKLIVTQSLLETHRGWLLVEAIDGSVDAAGLGNGMSTFRIRPTNLGSRTETHNDYSLLLYEQGLIGAFLFFYLIVWRASLAIKHSKLTGDRFLEASGSSLFGLLFALMFVNIIQTSAFWFYIGINFALLKILRKK